MSIPKSTVTALMRLWLCLFWFLSSHNDGFVDAVVGNMGFMKLKKIPGGFNAVIPDQRGALQPRLTSKGFLSQSRLLENDSSSSKSKSSAKDRKADSKSKSDQSSSKLKGSKSDKSASSSSRGFQLFKPKEDSSASSSSSARGNLFFKSKKTAKDSSGKSDSLTDFDNEDTWLFQGLVVATNAVGLAVSLLLAESGTHYHVDLLGTGALAIGAIPFLSSENERIQFTSAAVVAWSVKLAAYLTLKVYEKGGSDPRLTEILSEPEYCAGFWAFSALWGLLCALPYSVGLTSTLPGDKKALRIGAGVFGVGLAMETLADLQKWRSKRRGDTSFYNTGLWRLSQHPNWFGNLLLWSGILIANLPALYEKEPDKKKEEKGIKGLWQKIWGGRRVILAAVGPLFLWRMFHLQATGEMLGDSLRASRKKYGYGRNTDYTNYIDSTPLIVPRSFDVESLHIKW